jgi:hypothetical protein
MTDPHDIADLVSKTLRQAWQLGQTYWRQADIGCGQCKKADATQAKFDRLVESTRAAILTANLQPAPSVPDVDALAQFIRETNGKHQLDTGVLAERIVEWLASDGYDDYTK